MMELTVLCAGLAAGAAIPVQYTGFGRDVSPAVEWSEAPAGTKSIALICDDPDAPGGDWVHWVIFNLPPDSRGLPEGVPAKPLLDNGAIQGLNDFGAPGYRGPHPPPGRPHRYVFTVFALDGRLGLDARARKADLLRAMEGRVLAQGRWHGTFQRPASR